MAGKSRHNQDHAIVQALARGEGLTATATHVGCSVSTVRRRLEAPEIRKRVERFRGEMLDSAAGKLGAIVDQAVTTLKDLMTDSMPPVVRLGAARSVCDFALRIRESVNWERRLAMLEERQNANNSEDAD